ncbi:Glucose-6-phosphate/phosphate translocator 2 [Hibiscus syriacus]|uniref:Glucose-6-phosphate/phosphate translocator 2 n=1 Tax=Hibiscus syriacus TaxID=106335 RepID=A0A6A2XHC9_HIBSY|nr:Glucose-6-phosphate/phosphate translocator 2 [Hibiscus syriacus]
MSFGIKQSALTVNVSSSIVHKRSSSIISSFSPSVSLNLQNNTNQRALISVSKPLHISSIESCCFHNEKKPVIHCKAYEADKSQSAAAAEGKSETAQRVKIGIYFATWWALNVVFNIYNKKVLNVYPFPWLTSTLSLACGSLMMSVSWATRIAEPPKIDIEFWKALFPFVDCIENETTIWYYLSYLKQEKQKENSDVAVAHTIGHVAATVSMSKVAVSFTHIIKSGEPAFSVIISRFLLGETFPPAVYLSLLPIIGGCGLAALTELNFNMTAGMNYYACLCMLSLVILTPFAIAVEGPHMWAAGWKEAVSLIGPQFIWWMAAQSIFYHLYNQVSYMSLDQISPLTFSIGNTMKRISVIVSSIIIFHTPVQPINALGAHCYLRNLLVFPGKGMREHMGLKNFNSSNNIDERDSSEEVVVHCLRRTMMAGFWSKRTPAGGLSLCRYL